MFKKISEMQSHHQVLFAIVIAFAVISFWRGVWGLMDTYMLPETPIMSFWLSVAIGLAILSATHYVTKVLM